MGNKMYFVYVLVSFCHCDKCYKSNLEDERIYLAHTSRSHSITKSGQDRNSKQKQLRNAACCLTRWLVLSYLSYTIQDHIPRDWRCPQWARPSYIN